MAAAPLPAIALTGATGFVGRALLGQLAGRARVAALARPRPGRALAATADLRWVPGDLEDQTALGDLVAGADVVVHLAGATKAASRAAFHEINAAGTARLVQAARAAGVGHFILLSSLAATRPDISDYAASKAAGEAEARAHAGAIPLTIVRAPAVLGAGDAAAAPLFSMLARGLLLVPGGAARAGRFSMIDVADLCRHLLALTAAAPAGLHAPYGHHALAWDDLAQSAARARGGPVRVIALPGPVLGAMGALTDAGARLTGRPQVFSRGKVREMRAGDWIGDQAVSDPTPLDTTIRRCLAPHLRLRTHPAPAAPSDRRLP